MTQTATTRDFDKPHWYVAYTLPRHEKSVADHLMYRDVETYLPLYASVRKWNRRYAEVELPLFPGYVFVKMVITDRVRVLTHPGVIRLIGFNGSSVAIPDGSPMWFQRSRFAASLAIVQEADYGDPLFDVTLLNASSGPLVVGALGLEIVRVALSQSEIEQWTECDDYDDVEPKAERVVVLGLATVIPVLTRHVVDMRGVADDIIAQLLARRPKSILKVGVPLGVKWRSLRRLRDPVYLPAGAVYRFTLRLRDYEGNVPSFAELRLCVVTDRGSFYSEKIGLLLLYKMRELSQAH